MSVDGFSTGSKVGSVTSVTPTVSTSPAYTSGDQVGGLMTFTAGKANGRSGRITGIVLLDKAKQSATMELHLWDGASGPTITSTDNGVADITDANWNMTLYLGCVLLQSSAYNAFNGNSVVSAACAIDFVCDASNSSVFGLLVTRGTPTFAGTTDISVGMNVIQD